MCIRDSYAAGQWNVYATEDSLQKYHIPAFQVAVKNHTSSIMPYYSKPSAKKSKEQKDCFGNTMEFEPYGFAYNRPFIQNMLRDQIGFEGYINSDTGIAHNMCWGVEMLDIPERIGFAVNHAEMCIRDRDSSVLTVMTANQEVRYLTGLYP